MKTIVSLFGLIFLTTGLVGGIIRVIPLDQPVSDPTNQFHSLQDAVEASRGSGSNKFILIHPGEYYNVSITLDERDSGLTIEGIENQTHLYGGIQITNWQPVDNPVLAKAGWVKAALPADAENIRILDVDGEKRPRARVPQEGRLTHESEFEGIWQSTAGGGFDIKPTHEHLTSFIYKTGELGDWPGITNGEVTLFHSWSETLVSITGVDEESRTIYFTPEAGYPPGGFGYYDQNAYDYILWNVREGMRRPGQWYWDKTDKILYYWQLPGEDVRSKNVVIPGHEQVISLNGADHVGLRGFSIHSASAPMITGSDGASNFDGAISAENISHLSIENLKISNVTAWGIKVFGNHITIKDCEIAHTGAGAIRTRGDYVRVDNCSIHDVGEIYYSGAAVQVRRGRYATVSHNEIYNTSYSGIIIQCSDSVVEYNLIYNMMRGLNDGAAIYFTYNSGWAHFNYLENSVARYNIVIGGRIGGRLLAFYFDEYSRNCTFENNVAINASKPVHLHIALECTVMNNIFVSRGVQDIDFPRSHGITYKRNIAVADTINFITPDPDDDFIESNSDYNQFPKDEHFADKLKKYATGVTKMEDNLFFSRFDDANYIIIDVDWNRKSLPLGNVQGATLADPGFKDVGGFDFTFPEDSPAAKIGFVPIDLSRVGRRPSSN